MRAQFINEKFKEDTDPIKDMGIGAFTKKFIQREIKRLRGTVDEDLVESVIEELAQEVYGAAFEIYLDFEDKEEFYFLHKLMGKKRIKVIGFDIDDFNGPEKYSYDVEDQHTWMYDKKIQPWVNKGWTEVHTEENGDYYEYILVKYDK